MNRSLPKKKKNVFKSVTFRLVGIVTVLVTASMLFGHMPAMAAACPAPSTDNGTDTISVNVPATASYVMWTRIMVPDTVNNSINAQVDGTTCYNVGGSSVIPANTWTWVNYADGATATPITLSLSAGTHTVKLIGTKAGVSVDRVLFYSDTSCTPTGLGDNCQSGDSTPPTVSLVAPTNGSTATGSTTMTATASDASGIASVKFMVDGTVVNTDISSPFSFSWDSASVANGAHSLTAQAVDKANNTATSAAVSVTVNNTVTCTANPTVPTSLHSTGTTSSSISIAWTASTPGAACTIDHYNVYRNGSLVNSVASGTSYTDTGLIPGTNYSYTVAAVDGSGHNSAQTAAVNVTTAADSTPPSVPTNVHSTVVTTNSVALSWTASTDNVGVTGYAVFRNGTQIGTSPSATYTDSGLTANTSYTYTVKAYDAKNNTSAASTGVVIKTLTGTSASSGDLNNDGKVNITDLSVMLSHWNQTGVPITQGDCNGDGTVNIIDLSILLSHWG